MADTQQGRTYWETLGAPTLRKLVKEKHGDALNGGLMIAKKTEMVDLLAGDVDAGRLLTRLKQRATRRANGSERHATHKAAQRAAQHPGEAARKNGVARVTRRAASPLPQRRAEGAAPSVAAAAAEADGLAAQLGLAAALAGVPAIRSASAANLRAAVEAIIAIRG